MTKSAPVAGAIVTLATTQLAATGALLAASRGSDSTPAGEAALFAALAGGSAQATLVASGVTLGRGSLWIRALGGFVAVLALVVVLQGLLLWSESLQRMAPFMVGYGAVVYAVFYPLAAGVLLGAFARRAGWGWTDAPARVDPLAHPAPRRGRATLAIGATITLAGLALAAASAEALERWWLESLAAGGLDSHVALFGVAAIVSSVLTVVAMSDVPAAGFSRFVALAWGALVGVVWWRCPHTARLVAVGAASASLYTLVAALALRSRGWRIAARDDAASRGLDRRPLAATETGARR